jgi:hypothetical protein
VSGLKPDEGESYWDEFYHFDDRINVRTIVLHIQDSIRNDGLGTFNRIREIETIAPSDITRFLVYSTTDSSEIIAFFVRTPDTVVFSNGEDDSEGSSPENMELSRPVMTNWNLLMSSKRQYLYPSFMVQLGEEEQEDSQESQQPCVSRGPQKVKDRQKKGGPTKAQAQPQPQHPHAHGGSAKAQPQHQRAHGGSAKAQRPQNQ